MQGAKSRAPPWTIVVTSTYSVPVFYAQNASSTAAFSFSDSDSNAASISGSVAIVRAGSCPPTLSGLSSFTRVGLGEEVPLSETHELCGTDIPRHAKELDDLARSSKP